MYPHPSKPISGGSAPSEAWLFAQAILGKPIPQFISPETKARIEREELERLAHLSTTHAEELRRLEATEAESRHERELLEWAAGISPRAEATLRAIERKEAEEREAWRRAEDFAASLREGTWDASKHPRRGGPPNAGWWASTSGSGNGTGTSGEPDTSPSAYAPTSGSTPATVEFTRLAGHTAKVDGASQSATRPIPATTAQLRGPSHAPVHLAAAAASAVGHHWVPEAVFKALSDLMTPDALKIFELGTESTGPYDHAFDTWNEVTHAQYSNSIRELLKDWIKKNGGKLDAKGASSFLSWIATGKCGDTAFLKKHKALFDTVFKWRAGFTQSVVIATAAAEINPKLTEADLKGIAQQFVNGKPSKPLSKAAT